MIEVSENIEPRAWSKSSSLRLFVRMVEAGWVERRGGRGSRPRARNPVSRSRRLCPGSYTPHNPSSKHHSSLRPKRRKTHVRFEHVAPVRAWWFGCRHVEENRVGAGFENGVRLDDNDSISCCGEAVRMG